jgi:hypothetical protein
MNGQWATIRKFNQEIIKAAASVEEYGIAHCAQQANKSSEVADPAFIAKCLHIDTQHNSPQLWGLYSRWAQVIDLVADNNFHHFTKSDSNGRQPQRRVYGYQFQPPSQVGYTHLFKCTEHKDTYGKLTHITLRSAQRSAETLFIPWAYCPDGNPRTSNVNFERYESELTTNQKRRATLKDEIQKLESYIKGNVYLDLERLNQDIPGALHQQYRVLMKTPNHDDKVRELVNRNPLLKEYDQLLARMEKENIPYHLRQRDAQVKLKELKGKLEQIPDIPYDKKSAWAEVKHDIEQMIKKFRAIHMDVRPRKD